MRTKGIKLNSDNMMYIAIVMLIFLTCFPMTMCLPSSIRYVLQITAMLLFFIGLSMSRNINMIFMFVVVVSVMLIRVAVTWQYKRGFASCAFSVYAAWAFAFFGFLTYKRLDEKRVQKLFMLLFILTCFTAVTTIIGIERYPLVVRELGRGTRSYSGASGSDFSLMKWEYRLSNIAGWNQLYGMVYLVPIFLFTFRKTKRKIFLVGTILIEFCIIRSQLTFALLFSVVLIIFCFVKPSQNRKALLGEVILLLILLILTFNIDSIILLFVNITSSKSMTMLSNKLYDLYLLFQGVNTGDSLARTKLYSLSIDLFKEHPFIGQALYGVDSPYMFSYHSDFFDMLGYYGMFGLILVLAALLVYCRFINRSESPKWITYILLLGFLAMYVFNPVWYSPQIFIGVFMLPFMLSRILQTENRENLQFWGNY